MNNYSVEIDYGRGLVHLMDVDFANPPPELNYQAGELLQMLLMMCPKGITLEINSKETSH